MFRWCSPWSTSFRDLSITPADGRRSQRDLEDLIKFGFRGLVFFFGNPVVVRFFGISQYIMAMLRVVNIKSQTI